MDPNKQKWNEIKLYYFIYDIYNIRKDLMDIAYAVEAVAQIGQINQLKIKHLCAELISDITCQPLDIEIIWAAHNAGLSSYKIAKITHKSRQAITHALKKEEPPLFCKFNNEKDINEINNFLELLDKFQKAGIHT